MDPITATAMAMSSKNQEGIEENLIMISVDVVGISDGMRDEANLRDATRERIREKIPQLNPDKIIINATHTHAAPLISTLKPIEEIYGFPIEQLSPEKEVISPADNIQELSKTLASAAIEAWQNKIPAGISYGLSHAVVGRNRLQAKKEGNSTMYGNTNDPNFSHIEGYEDHALNLIFTWNKDEELTGILINIPAPSQVSEHSFELSADFWHDTRIRIKKEFGEQVHVFPQVSAAGDLSPHVMIDGKAEERMQRLMGWEELGTGRNSLAQRHQIANRITEGIASIFPVMQKNIDFAPVVLHQAKVLELPRRLLGEEDVKTAQQEAKEWGEKYQAVKDQLIDNPDMIHNPRWYRDATTSYSRMRRGTVVEERYELEKTNPTLPVEIHALRIGEIAMVTNPFELYLDYGMRMKARSPAVQTFVAQLTGAGSYLPTRRSIAGGAYGAVPASTLIGPEGGDMLVEESLNLIHTLFDKNE